MDYWKSYGIQPQTLSKYNVAPIRFGWVNDDICYSYKQQDLAYAYYFSEGVYKLYFPERTDWRFLGNHKGLQGYDQLPNTGTLLVVTKSLKDVMYLSQLGIAAVAPPSESSILTAEQYADLTARFDKMELEWKQEQKLLTKRRNELANDLIDLNQQRETLIAGIDSEAIQLYEGIKSRKGQAVVKVEQGRCQGCRITLPMSERQKARVGMVIQCSSCGKILYLG